MFRYNDNIAVFYKFFFYIRREHTEIKMFSYICSFCYGNTHFTASVSIVKVSNFQHRKITLCFIFFPDQTFNNQATCGAAALRNSLAPSRGVSPTLKLTPAQL